MPPAAAALLGLLLLLTGCGGGGDPLPAAGPEEPAPTPSPTPTPAPTPEPGPSRLLVNGQPVLSGYTIDVRRSESEPLAHDPDLVPDGPLPRYRYRIVIEAEEVDLFLDFELDEAEAPAFRDGEERPSASAVGKFVANGHGGSGLTLLRAVIDGFRIGEGPDDVLSSCTEPAFYIAGVFSRLDTEVEGQLTVQGNYTLPDVPLCGSRSVDVEFSAPVR